MTDQPESFLDGLIRKVTAVGAAERNEIAERGFSAGSVSTIKVMQREIRANALRLLDDEYLPTNSVSAIAHKTAVEMLKNLADSLDSEEVQEGIVRAAAFEVMQAAGIVDPLIEIRPPDGT